MDHKRLQGLPSDVRLARVHEAPVVPVQLRSQLANSLIGQSPRLNEIFNFGMKATSGLFPFRMRFSEGFKFVSHGGIRGCVRGIVA